MLPTHSSVPVGVERGRARDDLFEGVRGEIRRGAPTFRVPRGRRHRRRPDRRARPRAAHGGVTVRVLPSDRTRTSRAPETRPRRPQVVAGSNRIPPSSILCSTPGMATERSRPPMRSDRSNTAIDQSGRRACIASATNVPAAPPPTTARSRRSWESVIVELHQRISLRASTVVSPARSGSSSAGSARDHGGRSRTAIRARPPRGASRRGYPARPDRAHPAARMQHGRGCGPGGWRSWSVPLARALLTMAPGPSPRDRRLPPDALRRSIHSRMRKPTPVPGSPCRTSSSPAARVLIRGFAPSPMIALDSERSSADLTAATMAGESCSPHGVRSASRG